MKPIRIFLLLSSLLFIQQIIAQNLTISTGGETTPGTNWSITGNTLNVAASGSANIHPSVITNHLSSTGSLTITLPAQASVTRDIYINNSISYTGSNACTLTINAANELIVASGVSITSSTAAMNLVLRSIFSAGVPDYGRIQLNGTTINTNGGHFWAGGGSGNSTWNGLTVGNSYSRTWTDNVAGISFIGSTLNTNGGSIYMAGLSYNTSDGLGENYGVNIRNSAITSGIGQIDILGDLKGMYTTGSGLGIFGNSGAVTISSTTGAVNLTGTGADQSGTNSGWRRGALLYTLSSTGISVTSTSGNITITGTAAFPTNGNDDMIGLQLGSTQSITDGVKITSQTGNIKLTGSNTRENAGQNSNAVQFIAANVSNSIRIGSDGTNPYSGNITIEGNSIIQNNVNAGSGSISVQSTGPLTIQPLGNAFTYLRSSTSGTLTFDDDWNFGTNLGGFVYGKTTNTTALTYSNSLTTNGPITMYAGTLVQNGAVSSGGAITYNCTDFTLGIGTNISTSSASDITFNSNGNFTSADGTRRTISSANGNIIIHADKDAVSGGQLSIDYLTFNPGSGATIIRGETVSFYTGSVNGPFINGTGTFTFQSSDASFGSAINTSWFEIDQDNNGIGGLTIGKAGSIADIIQDRTIFTTGPVNMYGNNITFSAALTATNSDVSLYANTAVTQTLPIIAAGLSLNGTGTFTLTNTSNNFTTLAGGAVGSLLGTTQIIDVSGGLTIGTVGSTTGLTGSSTIRVETLVGNITLAGSISTTSTSTDALILTSAKSTAIGVPSGGDIIVSGSPTITIGAGAIAKLYSGYDLTSTGLTALAGGASNARNNYDETTTTFNPTLSANNKYAIYRTAFGYGDLNIVSSGGDAEGTTWNYVNGVITTTSGTANVLNTDVQTKLNAANLSIEANKITFSASVTGTTSNTFNVLSKTHILNTNATTISTQGGNVLFASNVDDATDGESTTNGYINLRFGITINSNGGNITFGGGNTAGSDYSLGSSTEAYTEGIRFDIVIALNSGGGNIALRGKSYAMGVQVGYGAAGIGFYFFSAATGTINSGTGTITIDGFSQTSTSTYASGIYSMHNINITSANTTANAIRLMGKATGVNGDAVGIETESIFSVFATGEGGGITISSSQQIADFYDVIFRGETNILAKSGHIQLLGKQDGGVANGRWYINNNFYLGSKALSAVPTSSSNITIQYDLYTFSGYNPKLAISGTLNWKPASTSFGQNVGTDYFAWNQNSQTLGGLTIGKSGNTVIVYLNSAITVAGPINVYGATIEITGALTASGSDMSLYATTAVTQSQPIISSGLSLNGTGTFTLTNTFNNFTTLAGGAVGSLIGTTQIVDVSGGLTIGTVGSNTGLTGSSTIRVETLAGNISLAGSISTTSTSTDAVILTAAKSTAIGIGTGGDIIVSGTPTITMGSGGIGKLFSGLEATSSGLTTLAGGSSNVRNNYDETTSTFSPVLSANNKHAIYRTSSGVGALTIVSSSGDAINTTWTYDNGVINTITTPVNILSSVIENYLLSGPLTINAGNTTVNAAITSISSNALVLNANSTLSNTTPTTTVNAAITNAGSITINTGAFSIAHNISTTSTAVISISANNGFSTTTATSTRYTISTVGGNITINADNDANGTGLVDIDDLTLNPGTANLIIRGETFNFNTTQTRKPYINGTGSFTFESNDVAFGQEIITNWFVLDQDANGMSGLTLGKSGSTANVTLNSVFTVAGPISAYGGLISVSSAITSSATGDILLKGITNSGSCINITAGITKSSGTGTLSMQGHGRVNVSAAISATGTGSLNVIMWSDYDGDNVGGGSTLGGGSISTNGGHIWMGGSNSSGGSFSWNGLAVGDGPSTGASGGNCNAIDLFGPITTAGGDVLLWASNNGGCGIGGIVSDGTRLINAGSGDITLIAFQTSGAIELTSTGVISLVPQAGSYASALTLGGTLTSGNYTFNTSHYNGLKINSLANSGLVIGNYSGHLSGVTAVTQGNTSTVTASSALSTKSLEIYGGAVVASAALTAAGNIILDGDNGSFLTQNTKGVEINAAVTTTNNGNITINGRGGNATAINTHGINVTNLVEAGGTGNIELIGYGGLSANGTGSSCHGVNIDGGSAWVKSNGGNVVITGYGGGAGAGTYSQGVPILTTARVSAGGTGTINITGTGGVNAAAGLRGVVITTNSSVYSAGGAISITGTNGTNGSDNSDGVTIDGSNVGSNTSGAITISGAAGGGTGSEAISFSNTNTLGGASHSNNILLRGDKFSVGGATSLLTTGQVTIEPNSDLFSSALTFPISSMTIANTITGLTIGKSTNTANITFSNATNINGPITVYGGTVTLIENISSSASGTISLYANALTISSGKTVTSSGQLIITPQSASTTIGIAGASGTLALPLTYFSTNFTDGFSNIQIGRNEHTAAISSNAFTLRDNMTFLTSGSLTLGGLPIMGSNNVTLGSAISSISGMPTYYFQTNGTGKVIRSLSNTSTLQFPIGNSSYNPVSITNNSGSVDNFSVRVLDAIENNSNLSAATYVNRTWDIGKTTSNTGAGIAFTFNWNAGEIVNGTLVNPILNHYGTYWETATGTSTAAAGSPILSLTHTGYMGTFSPFAISDASTPLPVSMASFNLNCSQEDVELKWQTASEHNSDYFQVETSLDGVNWEMIQKIAAAGFSQELLNYSAVDQDAARNQKYYRLKQVDFNGEFALYGPLKADCGAASTNIGLHPNPCESHLTLSIDTQIPTELIYTIANPEGIVLETKKLAVQSGITLYTLDVSNYPGGMYILQFDLNEKRYIKKLTVQ